MTGATVMPKTARLEGGHVVHFIDEDAAEWADGWQNRMRLIREAAMDFANALGDAGQAVTDMAEAVRKAVDASMDVERA